MSVPPIPKEEERTDEYFMNVYKVVPCTRKYAHDWASCPGGHKGERAARRDLNKFPHMAIACHYAQQRMECPLGDRCTYAHNMFEYWLHPQRYKTELCQFGTKCHRTMCFYGHSPSDLRPLDPTLPPPELSWSAGAAFSSAINRPRPQRQKALQRQQGQAGQPARQSSSSASYSGPPTPGSGVRRGQPASMAPKQQQQQQLLLQPASMAPQQQLLQSQPQPQLLQPQPQLQLQQQQQAQAAVMTSVAACETPRTPSLSPAGPAAYTQLQPQVLPQQQPQMLPQLPTQLPPLQQPQMQTQMPPLQQQPQQQVVVLLTGQGMGATAAGGGGVPIAAPVPSQGLPLVMPAGGMPAAHPMPAASLQPLMQAVQSSAPPTYILQVSDAPAAGLSSSSSCAPMAAGQVVQVGLPTGGFITDADLAAAQGCPLAGHILQPQQQPCTGTYGQLPYVCAAGTQGASSYVLVDSQAMRLY